MSIYFDMKQYMDGVCTHNQYFQQFVNKKILNLVASEVGVVKINTSEDEYLNDIPLRKWEAIARQIPQLMNVELFKKLNNVVYPEKSRHLLLWSTSTGVCIAKTAARIIRETDYFLGKEEL